MKKSMKHIAMAALMLNLGVAGVYAESPVRMMFTGNGGASAINLQHPNTNAIEEDVAGNGTFGPFTFRDVRSGATTPQASSTCAGVFFPSVAGGGILRFQDGSLLKVILKEGGDSGDCLDFVNKVGHCKLTLEIKGGTGRFQNATGVLTYTETALPAVFDGFGLPALTTEVGEITGTISGAHD